MAINTVGELKKFIENIGDDTKVRIYVEAFGETRSALAAIISKETLTDEEYDFYENKEVLPMLMFSPKW
jgi:hypothetical protein